MPLRRIVPVLLQARKKRAAGYINLVIFDGQGNIVRRITRRVRRATEAAVRGLARQEKANLEAKGYQVTIDPVTVENLRK